MARATPSAPLVITLVSGLVLLCGGLVVMTEYAKVELKKRDERPEQKPAAPAHPYAQRLAELTQTAFKSYAVTQLSEDDRPGIGRYVNFKEPGTYHDIVSREPVFSSRDKLEPQFGYAEFSKALDPERLVEERGVIEGEERLNVKGRKSGARLGWIVTAEDGTRRYVMNSSALEFVPERTSPGTPAAPELKPAPPENE
jgi:peptide-methionine (R)-S-oxide reductase